MSNKVSNYTIYFVLLQLNYTQIFNCKQIKKNLVQAQLSVKTNIYIYD